VKPSSRPHRTPSKLSDSVHRQLNMYALAASAAGVGMLALAQAAEAKVVYTPAHHVILRGSHFALDLNHDGITDFYIDHRSGCSSEGFCTAALYADGGFGGGNYVEGLRNLFNFAYALKRQQRVGSTKPFMGFAMYYRDFVQGTSGACSGSWVNVKNRYLGLRFILKGETHFGWARLNVTCDLHAKKIGLLTGYAYETKPNKPIITGKINGPDVITVRPASLGQMARGASAISGRARVQLEQEKAAPPQKDELRNSVRQ
jgi:hypothetical protein